MPLREAADGFTVESLQEAADGFTAAFLQEVADGFVAAPLRKTADECTVEFPQDGRWIDLSPHHYRVPSL
ncbi:MAG: hypothetical protein LUG93_13245 [Lachnospiraceae bacterium]|nr:hypothetical protein [Lachnospiraceae bacterium]